MSYISFLVVYEPIHRELVVDVDIEGEERLAGESFSEAELE